MRRASERDPDGVTVGLVEHLSMYCAGAACIAFALYHSMQPTQVANPGLAAYKPPRTVITSAVPLTLEREAITPAASGSRMSQPYSPPNSAMPEGSSSCRSRAQTTVRSRNSTKPASVSAAAATPALRGIDLRGHHHTWPGPGNRRRRRLERRPDALERVLAVDHHRLRWDRASRARTSR